MVCYRVKTIEEKPMYLPIGEGGPENEKEESGGADIYYDFTKSKFINFAPLTFSIYREKDVFHPIYTSDKACVDFSKLRQVALVLDSKNKLVYGSSGDKSIRKTYELYTCIPTSRILNIFVPNSIVVCDYYGETPDWAKEKGFNVRYYFRLDVMGKTIDYPVTAYWNVCIPPEPKDTYLGEESEDLTNLLGGGCKCKKCKCNDCNNCKYPNCKCLECNGPSGPREPVKDTNLIEEKPSEKCKCKDCKCGDCSNCQYPNCKCKECKHHHDFYYVSPAYVKSESRRLNVLFPDELKIDIGQYTTTWHIRNNKKDQVYYGMDSSDLTKGLWATVCGDTLPERIYELNDTARLYNLEQSDSLIFAKKLNDMHLRNDVYRFSGENMLSTEFVAVPTEKCIFGKQVTRMTYIVVSPHKRRCICGAEINNLSMSYIYHDKASANEFANWINSRYHLK